MCEWDCCSLLHDAATYKPDTLDLNTDAEAAKYWFPCFRALSDKFAKQAAASQCDVDVTATERAEKFRLAYLQTLIEYESKTNLSAIQNVILGTRELLEQFDIKLRKFGFDDPWKKQKHEENSVATELLPMRLKEIDQIINLDARWTELIRGVLAGNMFDWGAQAVANILENDKEFGLHSALNRIQKRPWLMDDLDNWLQRLHDMPHKCAIVFVDNSGVDIVLGILPFVRELLRRGTKVLLCANTEPSLNDVTSKELTDLIKQCVCHCSILAEAWSTQRLIVYENGQHGPCLDMRKLPTGLCEAIETNETDLLVIEGMGRAVHTNLHAKFKCDTLKLAVIKNKWLAEYLGGDMFAVMCKYERS